MTTRLQQPDPHDDDFSRLVGNALRPPPMSPEFAEELGTTLDAKFALLHGLHERAELERAGHERTTSHHGQALVPDQDHKASAPSRRLISRRLWVTLVTAASLLLAVGLLNSRPNYSWASMIEAMGAQPWVHAEAFRDGMVRVRRWVASGGRVDASQSDGRVVFQQSVRGGFTKLSFDPGSEQILEQRRAESPADTKLGQDWSQLLPRLIAAPSEHDAAPTNARVLHESWRRIQSDDGSELIELTVDLSISDQQVTWNLLLDPQTHLPVSATSADGGDSVRFSFPPTGPASIHALGVSEETELVTLDATNAPLTAPAPETEQAAPETEQVAQQNETVAEETVALPPLGDPLSGDALTAQIDHLLSKHWREVGVSPTGSASDAEFMRRVYLDLIGRIPTVGEARIFLDESDGEKRPRLVDHLLASRDHATHFAAVWRRWLVPPSVDLAPYGGPDRLDEWLADRFADNMPYDQLAKGLLLAEGRISESGPLLFYAALKLNPEEIARQTSRTFLGMQLDCAECHDHPFDDRIAQEDFWGFAAMFAQISRPRGKMNVTSDVLRVHDNRSGEVSLPDTQTVVPPRLPLSNKKVTTGDNAPFLRHQFVDWLVDPRNERFSQAVVNRVWAHLFGRGLVEPIDDIRADNPPVVPELLEMLALDFARSGYDLRRLVRQLTLTAAYQRTSQSHGDDSEGGAAVASDPAQASTFARMNLKSFTAEQLHDCIAVATRSAATAGGVTGREGLVRLGNTSREQFIRLFEAPGSKPVDYHAGIPQALTMMNGGLIHSATDLGTSGLLRSLSAPFFTDEQRIDTLFLATLSRKPTTDELALMSPHVATATDDAMRQQRLGDILWALLNTAEFTLNH